MLVKELISSLSGIDGDAELLIIKQVDSEYQRIFSIESVNDQHPVGVTIHIKDQDDWKERGL